MTVQASDVVLQRLQVTGSVTLDGADRSVLRESTINGDVRIHAGNDVQVTHNQIIAVLIGLLMTGDTDSAEVRENTISGGNVGLAIGDPSSVLAGAAVSASIHRNRLSGSTTGLQIENSASGEIIDNDLTAIGTAVALFADFAGAVRDNRIHDTPIGVAYSARAELIANQIFDNATGVVATVDSLTDGLGYVGSPIANEIFGNTLGLMSTGRVRGQHIRGNTTGVSGSGVLGDEDLQIPNLIEANVVGVASFDGVIQYNRFVENETGVQTTDDQTIFHNVFSRNSVAGIVASGSTDVRIVGNTMHALTGDNIRVIGGSSEVEVRNNILWVESGYDLFVDNDSQSGFFSDYNNLYSTDAGKLVHWIDANGGITLDFSDVLDWQQDVHRYDLNSIGTTVVDPNWAKPQFVHAYQGDYTVFAPSAGLRLTSPTIDSADPLSVLDWNRLTTNRLANPGFESGLASWSTNVGAGVRTSSPLSYGGVNYFGPGNDSAGFTQQTLTLASLGTTPVEVDSRDLTVAFGGRVRSGDADSGQITIRFLDGVDAEIGSRTAIASNVTDRWELVGDRVAIPSGTRKVVFRFAATQLAGPQTNSYLDDAFVYVLSEDDAVDQGAFGDQALGTPLDRPRIALRTPDLYVDFQRDLPGSIEWDTFGNGDDLPVRIDLLQDTPSGPVHHTTIAAVTDDDGSFNWTPADDLVDYGTYGWRIQVSLVGDPLALDRSSETFAVPENTNQYYVNDQSLVGDEYTTAVGDNRNTGKLPDRPKPYANNILRIYSLGAAQTMFQDTGSYAAFDPTVISNIVGVGDDEGFVWTGPVDPGHIAENWHAHPDTVAPLVTLNDADLTAIQYLTFRDAQYGIVVRNDSTAFSGHALTLTGHSLDGILIQDNAEFTTLSSLIVSGNGRHGIFAMSAIESIIDSTISGNAQDGINAVSQDGLLISNNTIDANQRGIYLESVFNGSSEVSDNEVLGSLADGIVARRGSVLRRNAVHDNAARGIFLYEAALAEHNVVFGNNVGIQAGEYSRSSDALRNRVYNNASIGIDAYRVSNVLQNTVYGNPVGIYGRISNGQFRGEIDNNLVYDSDVVAILLDGAASVTVDGNTVYQTAGDGIRIQNNSPSVALRSNILWADGGHAISVASDSQTGFSSDYNLLRATGSGQIALWQGVPRPTLVSWRNAAFHDANSIDQDPAFVDIDGADDVLGYVDPVQDGRDDDFHLMSTEGRFAGSLTPVFDTATHRAVMLPVTETTDGVQSPAIDRGDANSSFVFEPQPNGSFINLGSYGNSEQASKSPLEYVLVTRPDGGEVWPQDQSFTVRWRSDILENSLTGGLGSDYQADVLADAPVGYWRFDDAGEFAVDSAAVGTAQDGTYENGVFRGSRSLLLGDVGLRFGGSDGRVVIPDAAELKPPQITVESLVFPQTGISNYDFVMMKSSSTAWNDGYGLYYYNGNLHFYVNNYSSGDIFAPITLDQWSHVAATYDGAMMRLYVNGSELASAAYSTPINHSGAPLLVGQSAGSTSYTWTGQIDELAVYDAVLAPAQISNHALTALTPLGTQVDVELIRDGDAGFNLLIADDAGNSGQFDWFIPGSLTPQNDYRIRVTRVDTPALTDTSNLPFSITEPIDVYYVNLAGDVDFTDNEYTTAAGDDANSGLSPSEPKASISALLQAFDLDAGDTILVDTGVYTLSSNILLETQDSGVQILGAVGEGHETILDRGNTASGSYVFDLAGADDVILESLGITGGYYGIFAGASSDSDNVSVRGSRVFANAREEIYLNASNDGFIVENSQLINGSGGYDGLEALGDAVTVRNSVVQGHSIGLYLQGKGNLVEDNEILFNSSYGVLQSETQDTGSIIQRNQVYRNYRGIRADSSSSTLTLIDDNRVFGSAYNGIEATYDVLVSNNVVWDSVYSGIAVSRDAVAENNTAYNNQVGVTVGEFSHSGIARSNRTYGNEVGIRGYRASMISENVSFSNIIGIQLAQSNSSRVETIGNLIYDNSDVGIETVSVVTGTQIVGNTIFQPVGSAVRLTTNSSGVELRNNIVEVGSDYAFVVNGDSQNGFKSDHNLIYAPGVAKLALWGATEFDSCADWFYELGFDGNSQFGELPSDAPGFFDVDGVDDFLGYSTAALAGSTIIDDGDPGYSETGAWTPYATGGYNGDYRGSTSSGEPGTASWTFSGLTPGSTYEVATTYTYGNFSTNADYRVLDASGLLTQRLISQYFNTPNDFSDSGTMWERLGVVTVSGATLTVELDADDTARDTLADAILIREIVGDRSSDDDFHLVATSAAIDAGSLADPFGNEPSPNGARVNLGFYGNTAEAASSAADVLQVISPNGLQKYEIGDTIDIQWHAAGGVVQQPADVTYASMLVADSAAAYWRLGEAAGATTTADNSGNGHVGTVVGSPLGAEGVFGPGFDMAMTLTASSGSYVEIPDAAVFNAPQFTVEAWIMAESGISSFDAVINKSSNTGFNDGYGIYYYNGNIQFFVDQYNLTNDAKGPLPLNEWTHVTATFDGGTARLYVNGQLAGERTGITLDPTTTPIEIGRGRNSAYEWSGRIDEVAYYDSVLSESTILAHANTLPLTTVDIELVDELTGVPTLIANNQLLAGKLSWTIPPAVPADREYRIRVTSVDPSMPSDLSNAPLQIANSGTNYYVNDSSTVGDEYTTAVGDNTGTGKSPSSPMSSLRALLEVYDLDPGDRVFVDTGTYSLVSNIVIGAEDAGVEIIGAVWRNNSGSWKHVRRQLRGSTIRRGRRHSRLAAVNGRLPGFVCLDNL